MWRSFKMGSLTWEKCAVIFEIGALWPERREKRRFLLKLKKTHDYPSALQGLVFSCSGLLLPQLFIAVSQLAQVAMYVRFQQTVKILFSHTSWKIAFCHGHICFIESGESCNAAQGCRKTLSVYAGINVELVSVALSKQAQTSTKGVKREILLVWRAFVTEEGGRPRPTED